MLTVLFLKFAPKIIKFIKNLLNQITAHNNQEIFNLIGSKEYEQAKLALLNFSSVETGKRQKIYKFFNETMKGHQLL